MIKIVFDEKAEKEKVQVLYVDEIGREHKLDCVRSVDFYQPVGEHPHAIVKFIPVLVEEK